MYEIICGAYMGKGWLKSYVTFFVVFFYLIVIMISQVCQILSGTATVTGADGVVVELKEGTTFVTPMGWKGQWVVHTLMRKMFVIRSA
jgi:hypothetical protein